MKKKRAASHHPDYSVLRIRKNEALIRQVKIRAMQENSSLMAVVEKLLDNYVCKKS